MQAFESCLQAKLEEWKSSLYMAQKIKQVHSCTGFQAIQGALADPELTVAYPAALTTRLTTAQAQLWLAV